MDSRGQSSEPYPTNSQLLDLYERRLPTNPNRPFLRELGFDCYEKVGSGAFGIVFKGVCNTGAKKSYLIDKKAAKRQMRAGVRVRAEQTPEGINYSIERSLAGKPCAIKVISATGTPNIYNEMLVSLTLVHPNCVEIYGIVTDLDNSLYYLISEYLNGQAMDFFLQSFDGTIRSIDELLTIETMVQLVSGLEYLHSNGIIHGDLHSGNIMYNISPESGYQWKYLDFGMSAMTQSPARRTHDIADLGFIFMLVLNMSAIEPEKKAKLNQLTDSMENSYIDNMTQVSVQLNTIVNPKRKFRFNLPFFNK